jgi:N-acetylneuraminic acid mutarotase
VCLFRLNLVVLSAACTIMLWSVDGDDVLAFDTQESKWSRVGKLPYGCITAHCGTNGTHVICTNGEPRHGHNGNAESVVQIAKITTL